MGILYTCRVDYKQILGVVAVGIALVSYIPYFRDILANKTKPHAFSGLVWTILTVIGFAAQISDNAGPGAWVTGVTAVLAFIIFVFALIKGRKNIVLIDWAVLAGALLAILMWQVTKEPVTAVILVTISDALGFVPTFRKSYMKPWGETLSMYILSGTKHVVAIFALENFSVVTSLYSIYLIGANASFVSMLLWRRRQVKL